MLALIRDRLKAQLGDAVRSVGAAADMASAMGNVVAVPACYVIPLGEDGQPNEMLGVVRQAIHQTVGVVLVVSNAKDLRGGEASIDLEDLRGKVKRALIGWTPDPQTGYEMAFEQGRLLSIDERKQLWWADRFVCQYDYIRQP